METRTAPERTVLLCFQQPSDAQSARILTMTEGIAQVVTCPYEEQFEIRNARGRGDLNKAAQAGGLENHA